MGEKWHYETSSKAVFDRRNTPVCTCVDDKDGPLIAAAPQLLAACEAALKAGEVLDEEQFPTPVIGKLRAAIAAAKGSSNEQD